MSGSVYKGWNDSTPAHGRPATWQGPAERKPKQVKQAQGEICSVLTLKQIESGNGKYRGHEMTKKNPYRRIEQLEARALAAARITREIPIIVINEGKPGAVSCVKGPDGRDVWWNPPEGHQCGELLAGDTHGGLHLDPAGFPGEIHILLVPDPNGRASPLTRRQTLDIRSRDRRGKESV